MRSTIIFGAVGGYIAGEGLAEGLYPSDDGSVLPLPTDDELHEVWERAYCYYYSHPNYPRPPSFSEKYPPYYYDKPSKSNGWMRPIPSHDIVM